MDDDFEPPVKKSARRTRKTGAAHCALCGLPGPMIFAASRQASGCACAFPADGSPGVAFYGSVHDDSGFLPAESAKGIFAGADPVCDACLGRAVISGQVFDLGAPREFGGPRGPTPSEDQARAAQERDLREQCSWAKRRR